MEKLCQLKEVNDAVRLVVEPLLHQQNPSLAPGHASAVAHYLAAHDLPSSIHDVTEMNEKCNLRLSSKALEELTKSLLGFVSRGSETLSSGSRAYRIPTVSLNSLQRCRTTVQDFVKSYFMFHGLQQDDFFRYMDTLLYVEATIYQLDEANESVLLAKGGYAGVQDGMDSTYDVLCSVLQQRGLWDERIANELKEGREYWNLERQLCQVPSQRECTIEIVDRAIRLKSFDFRVMNLVLYKLRGVAYDEVCMDFMSTSELLVEISDDLYDYEDDVAKNSFNVYRFFVRMYGTDAPARMMEYITKIEKEHETKIGCLPVGLRSQYEQRCSEAMDESGPGTGRTWVMPPIILDEERFRSGLQF